MASRTFRFSVGLGGAASRDEWRKKAQQAEDLGFDVVTVPDHLGMISPFPALITMAEATNRVRVGTMVLDGAFYRSAWLARDVASVAQLTDGRFELGLGAGPDFAKPEFEALGLPFPSGRQRIEHLRDLLVEMKALFAGDHQPPVHDHIPLLVAGGGDRLLRVAAEHADTISVAGIPVDAEIDSDETGDAALARRAQFVRDAAGPRFPDIELGLTVQAVEVKGHGEVDLTLPRMFQPHLTDPQLRHLPGFLHGSPRTIADTLRHYRAEYSITHFSVNETQMTALAKVIEELR
ncbi:TIGR03621 family F420-dependent LLM class oxidoreductase [Nocardia sp. CDC153]|uniref:TIGR03621 family F420-dependent LLM class oxidoreductase n=1 Tax=Nocardia sp. CDC153 TaxID=3112167 RepID=UPI002DBA0492|nr:TIGR03621 family F420-dependent LLM class oxidoreductase [Nocardia sp. CDC153]MEC3952469.1 TIGR03621 family F420-dependent LLM class oxidoreductase [Nocardia sp. CDC153]